MSRQHSLQKQGSGRHVISAHMTEERSRSLLLERDAQIAALEQEVTMLQNKLSTLSREDQARGSNVGGGHKRRHHPLTPYGHYVHETTSKCGAKRRQLHHLRARMGRNASVATAAVLNALPDDEHGMGNGGPGGTGGGSNLAQRIVDMFKDPAAHINYLNSDKFARDVLKLNSKVKPILESEPRVAFLQSPAYVFGDIHGNLEDLHFFSDNVWRLGMALTAGNFVFLGDYVDRGMSCLECVAYLLSMKLLLPRKVFLLRGNHETRDVNGWEEHYGERSFLWQCRDRFGDDLGYRVWEQTNQVFDRMPLAAVIDQDIFCVHGGIPRPVSEMDDDDEEEEEDGQKGRSDGGGGGGHHKGMRVQDILSVPRVAGINPPYEHEDEAHQQVASDCIWSDPASEEQERTGVDPATGFGESLRGGGAICFGHRAVSDFLRQQGFSYIMRAHEAHAEGVAVSKGARVFTVFSTSKDHNQGSKAMAGCILVDFEKMQVINRSPAYRNQYVHRRDSVSVARLSAGEIEKRVRLGLITHADDPGQDGEEEEEEDVVGEDVVVEEDEYGVEEEWDDLVEEDDDDDVEGVGSDGNGALGEEGVVVEEDDADEFELKIDSGRKSSVDPTHTIASPPGGSHDNHVWGDEQSGGGGVLRGRGGSDASSGSVGGGADAVDLDPAARHMDFSNVEMGDRKKRRNVARFSVIREEDDEDGGEDGDDDDEEDSTVDGEGGAVDDVDDSMEFVDEENQAPDLALAAPVSSSREVGGGGAKERKKYPHGKASF